MPSSARFLMCPPEYYGIEYEINPWMDRRQPADQQQANAQWQALHQLLLDTGASIALAEPQKGLPDLVFSANAALVYQQRAILSHFLHEQRQAEQPYWECCLTDLGFEVDPAPTGMSFEGAGDALFCGKTLFAGYRIRSDALGHQTIAADLGIPLIPLELIDDYYYHLDTCFCPLNANQAIYFPPAFDPYGRQVLSQTIDDLIAVDAEEAGRFACNAVVVGKTVITNSGCPQLHEALAGRGYEPQETDLSEFVKAGGSAKCLTLRLDGEEAADW
ncbi:MAG: arginine deiminase-related protein [Pirellulales bacterium]|nr:arginine deiminase-related protein [Pirellulales bacterium]